jgi:hypothetical protein
MGREQEQAKGPRKRSKGFFTPYAPAVLTLREPSTAIPLGCGVSFPENTVYADVVIADSPLCDLAEFNFQQGRRGANTAARASFLPSIRQRRSVCWAPRRLTTPLLPEFRRCSGEQILASIGSATPQAAMRGPSFGRKQGLRGDAGKAAIRLVRSLGSVIPARALHNEA